MTTPINSISPFAGSNANSKEAQETPRNAEEFSIHTMQDDLLDLQKKSETASPGNDNQVIKKIVPIQAPAPEDLKKVINPNDVSSKIVHPFVEKIAAPKQKGPDIVDVPSAVKNISRNNSSAANDTKTVFHKILVISAVVLSAAIIGLGGYYFWITRTAQQQPPLSAQTSPEVTPPAVEPPVTVTPPLEKYSAKNPNYLPIDLNTLSTEDIKKSINDVAQELKTGTAQSPYEFIVVDNNNTPVAFPIFATAAKLNLSAGILKDLGETFSLFLYNDNGNMRLSVIADITKPSTLSAELSKQEKTFVTAASFLFLNEKPEMTAGLFKDSTYNNEKIRFFNVNKDITLSIDYAIVDKQLVIATSKNTMRAVLDDLAAKKNTAATLPGQTVQNNDSAPSSDTSVTNAGNSSASQGAGAQSAGDLMMQNQTSSATNNSN